MQFSLTVTKYFSASVQLEQRFKLHAFLTADFEVLIGVANISIYSSAHRPIKKFRIAFQLLKIKMIILLFLR
jgi:hypothetical protein